MATLDLETANGIEGLLGETKQLLKAVIVLIDGLYADDTDLQKKPIFASMNRLDDIEGILGKQEVA